MSQSPGSCFVIGRTLLIALILGHGSAAIRAAAAQSASAANRNQLIFVTSKDGTRIGVDVRERVRRCSSFTAESAIAPVGRRCSRY